MRRCVGAAVCCIVLLCSFVFVYAEPEASARVWDGADLLTPGIFSIDGAYVQEGMNAAYENGYAPVIRDDALQVILPLTASRPVDGDIIYCSLDLGNRENSPFVYNNYQSIPVRPKYPDTEEQGVDPLLYVASFSLPLSSSRINGIYPLTIEIRYKTDQVERTQLFTIDFTVADEEGPGEPTPEPGSDNPGDPGGSTGIYDPGSYDPGYDVGISDGGAGGSGGDGSEVPPSEPKVILQSAATVPDPADAGASFTVTCTLHNTSKKQKVSNMTVSYKSQTTDLIPLGGASTQYIESIDPDKTVQFAFEMESRLDAASGPQKIDLALAYEGPNGTAYTATDEITVQIRQRLRLEYDEPSFPAAVYIGDSINATLNLYNKGKGTLYNVTVSLDVPGIEPESSSFVGNMESGTSKSAEIYGSVVGLPAEFPEGNAGGFSEEEIPAGEEMPAGIFAENMTEIDGAVEDVTPAQAGEADAGAAEMEPEAESDFSIGSGGGAGTGETEGEFLVTYEDEFGEIYEEHIPVSTTIMEMEYFDEPMVEPMEPEETNAFPWWGWILIAGGGAAAVAVPVIHVRKKRRARQLEEEVEDDDLY